MRFGAACSNVHDPGFRGCFTIPRAHVFSSASGSGYSRPLRLLELGAGTAAKTGILLEAATRLRNEVIYFPVDVSSDALDAACDSIGCLLPDVQLQPMVANYVRSEEHTSELQSRRDLVCRLLLEKKKKS